jgi:deoxyribodipyrimidine photo-lyase
MEFIPTREAALARLEAFVPQAGRDYARLRNFDVAGHPHVSGLSPYLRHRVISEEEVLRAVLARHSAEEAEKFIQEVYWRTYWKGWLERRPSIWAMYQADVARGLDRLAVESGLRTDWEAACRGETGIACFDAWARELAATGYLHNHARMWFASIWIFTLRLPWALGADFFMRHLLDGDAASNTLGWRWVAGLQTVGKTYLAREDNISKYTGGRFMPSGQLAKFAAPVEGFANPALGEVPVPGVVDRSAPFVVVLTEDDLCAQMPEGALGVAGLRGDAARSPLMVSVAVKAHTAALVEDAISRAGVPRGPVSTDPADIVAWAQGLGASQIIMPYVPQGPARDLAAGLAREIKVLEIIRAHDATAWPHAKAGFFKFKTAIPALIRALDQPSLI